MFPQALDDTKYFIVSFALFCNGEVRKCDTDKTRLSRQTDISSC